MKTVLACVFACLMALAFTAGASAQHHRARRHTGRPHTSASQLRRHLQSLRAQRQEVRKELQTTKKQADVVVGDIEKVDAELDDTQGQLDDTTTRLSQSVEDQRQLGIELHDATSKLNATREQVRQRLRHMYVRGNTSTVSAFVGTKTVGDVASRRFLLELIAKRDRELFSDYQRLRDLVSQHKRRQDLLVVRIGDLSSVRPSRNRSLRALASTRARC